jgi:hypothetical protein
MSGVGYAELACQNAADYARGRLSGRASGGARCPDQPADPIIVHPDVRRLLLDARAFAEGARCGALQAALWQSLAEHHPDPAQRERAADLLDLLVPVMKAFFTDRGFDAAVACQQVLGGHGYIRDHGLEQIVRNARIGQLYEGANGIQAVDLLHRKLAAHGGRAGRHFLQALADATARHRDSPPLAALALPLDAARQRLATTLDWVHRTVAGQPAAAEAGAYDLLTTIGIVYLGWMWLEIAAAALPGQDCRCADESERLRKLQLARTWVQRQLPLVDGLCNRIESGNDSLLALADDAV